MPKNFTTQQRRSKPSFEAIEHITSASNNSIKMLKSLDRKKGRLEHDAFLAEGARLVLEGLNQNWKPKVLLVGQETIEETHMQALTEQAHSAGARILSTTSRVLSSVAKKENAQAVLCAFQPRPLSVETFPTAAGQRYLALYQVRDPGNLGTIIRTSDATGIAGIILLETCCDPYSIEAVRATMGSLFSVPLVSMTLEDFKRWKIKTRAQSVAASVNGQQRHDTFNYDATSLIMMGNEQAGVPQAVEDDCDALVKLPMMGGADSLNLAQATAVMIYEVWRQRGFRGAIETS